MFCTGRGSSPQPLSPDADNNCIAVIHAELKPLILCHHTINTTRKYHPKGISTAHCEFSWLRCGRSCSHGGSSTRRTSHNILSVDHIYLDPSLTLSGRYFEQGLDYTDITQETHRVLVDRADHSVIRPPRHSMC